MEPASQSIELENLSESSNMYTNVQILPSRYISLLVHKTYTGIIVNRLCIKSNDNESDDSDTDDKIDNDIDDDEIPDLEPFN